MSVSVVVPFAGGCAARERALGWVRERFAQEHPAWEVVVGAGDAGAWSKAVAVADGLRRASGDVLAIHDADVWTDGLAESVDDVVAGAGWAIPHRHVHRLDQASTARFFAGERDGLRLERPPYWGKRGGGVVVLPRETYEQVPLDPRFVGWGPEDISWGLALSTLVGKPARRRAPLWHFAHPPQPERSILGSAPSRALGERYARAQQRTVRMRSIIEEVRDGSTSGEDQPLGGARSSAR